jgi:hypothetical protein
MVMTFEVIDRLGRALMPRDRELGRSGAGSDLDGTITVA